MNALEQPSAASSLPSTSQRKTEVNIHLQSANIGMRRLRRTPSIADMWLNIGGY